MCCPSPVHARACCSLHASVAPLCALSVLSPVGNSIAFGSAPRREADSQPISPLARPAVSQTETHSLGFSSVADAAPSSGEIFRLRASSGRMVMQLTGVFMVGGSNPGRANMALPPPTTVDRPGFVDRRLKTLHSGALPFDRRWCDSDMPPHCLEPAERKLLTPPHPPLSKKCYPVVGDRGLRTKKSIGGWSHWAK